MRGGRGAIDTIVQWPQVEAHASITVALGRRTGAARESPKSQERETAMITRGFHGKRVQSESKRLPPG